ncbi:signal recognition particle receptor subunit beta [Archangium gephyra]|uniref:Gliding motility protein MglA n=1 Tax=Archangium gephyra TaxID=48 RepID=A0AAC8QCT7_9BACT|nr:ADP-ribosylation factor-like protein [Archangium gephyra]AKJ05350.1 gliding motility protein MglA [Archangium gephyra]REG36036.1 signal recognition particle receptor subunit beta [Archangium gephyra]
MSSVNLVAREVAVKIVFYGPGLSGKTTSLRKVYETVRPAHRGEMMSIATEGDRTLFFDFLPVKVERVNDCTVRLALYTVPGQVFYNATRKLVLQGADGVVFVADSQPEMMDANRESLANLEENLLEQGVRLERFPLVFQWNKRDIPKALPVAELRAALNPRNVPDFETEALSGRGVLDALKAITRLVIQDLRVKRIVPPPRASTPGVPSLGSPKASAGGGLEAQLSQHLASRGPSVTAPATATASAPLVARPSRSMPAVVPQQPQVQVVAPAVAPPALTGQRPLGPASALAPSDLFDHARAAEGAFSSGDYGTCIQACLDAARRGLAFAGEGTLGAQAHLLHVDGADLLRLQTLAARSSNRVDDAAFALYVLMQIFSRLHAAGLPTPAAE